MKKGKIEDMLKALYNIKDIINKENYNLSTAINQNLIKVIPLLEAEFEKLDNDKVVMNCPSIMLLKSNDCTAMGKGFEDYMNDKIKELVLNEYKIVDFGIIKYEHSEYTGFIKYTN